MFEQEKEPEFEPCEMCGTSITYSFSLCNECDEKVKFWDEETGFYHMKDGEIIDTTKHQYSIEDANTIVELDGFKFSESYLYDAVDHFNTSIGELKEISGREDLKVYPSYRTFFDEYYPSTYNTMEQLIDSMGKDYFILANGEVIYIYP